MNEKRAGWQGIDAYLAERDDDSTLRVDNGRGTEVRGWSMPSKTETDPSAPYGSLRGETPWHA